MKYRQYENHYKLEEQLKKLKEERNTLNYDDDLYEDRYISLSEDIAELEERINFAWQDDEFDAYGY